MPATFVMQVLWFKKAVADLILIKDYIARDNPQAAQMVVLKIREKVALLREHPGIGRLGRVNNTKELLVNGTPYILPYRVCDNRIEILRVLHASRKWPQTFSQSSK